MPLIHNKLLKPLKLYLCVAKGGILALKGTFVSLIRHSTTILTTNWSSFSSIVVPQMSLLK